MRLVCVSDIHFYPMKKLPDGDVLIVAGDLTSIGTMLQLERCGQWLSEQPHQHKIVIAGNHDFLFEKDYGLARLSIRDGDHGIVYLQDQVWVIDDVVFYGAPWSVKYMNWAFGNEPKTAESHARWLKIPEGIDILITHGPPSGILDATPNGYRLGDPDLLSAVQRLRPKIHIFGHVHHSHGTAKIGDTLFVNAAICDEEYKHTQEPIVLDYRPSSGTVMQVRTGGKR